MAKLHHEIIFHAAVFLIAASLSFARSIADGNYTTFRRAVAAAIVGGGAAFFVISVAFRNPLDNVGLGLGIAAGLGVAGKDVNDLVIVRILTNLNLIKDKDGGKDNERNN